MTHHPTFRLTAKAADVRIVTVLWCKWPQCKMWSLFQWCLLEMSNSQTRKYNTRCFCSWSTNTAPYLLGGSLDVAVSQINGAMVHNGIIERQLFCGEKLHTLFVEAIMEMLADNFACLIACFALNIKIKPHNCLLICNGSQPQNNTIVKS